VALAVLGEEEVQALGEGFVQVDHLDRDVADRGEVLLQGLEVAVVLGY
jgi:hypothetical protein